MDKNIFIRKGPQLWEIPASHRKDMRVPAHVYALEELLPALLNDRSMNQLMNVATLKGIRKAAMVMPDVHEGYGFPIGGVAATDYPDGVISPGGIGYDINCGVRVLRTTATFQDVKDHLEDLAKALYKEVPSGMGQGGSVHLNRKELDAVLLRGSEWSVEKGYLPVHSLEHIESHGRLKDADPGKISDRAKDRGSNQLGTIGSGNHFAEVDRVETIFSEEAAQAYGLSQDQIVILIHTGSRGLGHQVATDYVRLMMSKMADYGIELPDRELACVPFSSLEGQDYFKAMCAAANFAWCNRDVVTWEIGKAWKSVFGKDHAEIDVLYDVAHNIAKIEEHQLNGETGKVIVHRKGATRAFGPGFQELPEEFRHIGQPVLIPGSMGTHSYILAGSAGSMQATFGSSCHGAGRAMSRTAAKKQVDAPALIRKLKEEGIYIQAGSYRGVAEEAPLAYKDVNLVVETVHQANIARKVARLRPLAVIKG